MISQAAKGLLIKNIHIYRKAEVDVGFHFIPPNLQDCREEQIRDVKSNVTKMLMLGYAKPSTSHATTRRHVFGGGCPRKAALGTRATQ
jgi:hypothetical protein